MYFILLKMFLLHTASLKNTATTNLFLAANLHPERDQRRLAVLKTTGFAMNRDASTADIRTANPLKWGRCLIWSLFNFRWVGVQHPPTTQFLHPNTKGWTILWKNKPKKWKKRIPFFPDIAVENGPFEDLVPNGSRKKKHPKRPWTTKLGTFWAGLIWPDLSLQVGLRNYLTGSHAKFFPNS